MMTTIYILDALRAEASGYLLKDLPAPDLASAVWAVYKGIYQLDPAVANKVISSLSRLQTLDSPGKSPAVPAPSFQRSNAETLTSQSATLTGREIEVLRLIAKGATNREGHLGIFGGSVLGGQVAVWWGSRYIFFLTSAFLLLDARWVYFTVYRN